MSRYYTKSQEWVDFDESLKIAAIGMTDYGQQQMGEIIHVELPRIGTVLEAGESSCMIESVKTTTDLYSPVAGKVVAINKDVQDNPCLLNDEAEKSWVFKVTYTQKPEGLLTPEQYAKMMAAI